MQIISCPISGVQIKQGYDPPGVYQTRWFAPSDYKSGKTTFMASIPKCLIADREGKVRDVANANAAYFAPASLNELLDVVKWVASGKSPYLFMGFDTVDEIVDSIIIPDLTSDIRSKHPAWTGFDVTDYGSKGKGWGLVSTTFTSMLRVLDRGGIGWMVAGHVKTGTKTVTIDGKEQEVPTSRPAVNPLTYGALYRLAEFIVAPRIAVKVEKVRAPRLDANGKEVVLTDPRTKKPLLDKDGNPKIIMDTKTSKQVEGHLRVVIEKEADSMTEVGTNIRLPDDMVLPPVNAWESVIVPAYNTATRQQETK